MDEETSRDFGEIEAWCQRRGVALTATRRLVLEILVTATGHPSAHDVHRLASARQSLGVATVYRTLNALTEAGVIARHEFGDGRARYECVHRGPRPHLIDIDDGQIVKVDDSGLTELLQVEAERLGFRLVNYRLQIMGQRPRAGG